MKISIAILISFFAGWLSNALIFNCLSKNEMTYNDGYEQGIKDSMVPDGTRVFYAKSASMQDVKEAMDKSEPGDMVFIPGGNGITWEKE